MLKIVRLPITFIPTSELFSRYLASAYDAMDVVGEAMVICGEDTACIKSQLYAVNNRPGAAGNLTLDRNGDPIIDYVVREIR